MLVLVRSSPVRRDLYSNRKSELRLDPNEPNFKKPSKCSDLSESPVWFPGEPSPMSTIWTLVMKSGPVLQNSRPCSGLRSRSKVLLSLSGPLPGRWTHLYRSWFSSETELRFWVTAVLKWTRTEPVPNSQPLPGCRVWSSRIQPFRVQSSWFWSLSVWSSWFWSFRVRSSWFWSLLVRSSWFCSSIPVNSENLPESILCTSSELRDQTFNLMFLFVKVWETIKEIKINLSLYELYRNRFSLLLFSI